MQLSFRQGVVDAPVNFLQQNGTTVDLNITHPNQVIVTFADGTTNYLYIEKTTITNAWTGPFVSGPATYWLYWDIDIRTGIRTFGHTELEPVTQLTAPSSPSNDQHWFDTTTNTMKVFNVTTGRWIKRIRVFAAKLVGGSIIEGMIGPSTFEGSQVGLLTSGSAGSILFDVNNDPIKRGNYFFTTEDVAVTGVSAAQIKLAALTVEAVAVANIPAFSFVVFTDFNQIDLATNFDSAGTYGIIEVAANQGDTVGVTMQGLITNPGWDWTTAGVNAPLYIDTMGNLTPTPPQSPTVVATVVDVNTILIRPAVVTLAADPITNVLQFKNEGTNIGTPSATTTVDFVGDNIHAAFNAGIVTVTVNQVDPSIVTSNAANLDMISSHARNIVLMTSDSANTYTVRNNATVPLPVGTTIIIGQNGDGATTLVADGGVTINTPETLTIRKKFGKVTITKTATDVWDVDGNLTPV